MDKRNCRKKHDFFDHPFRKLQIQQTRQWDFGAKLKAPLPLSQILRVFKMISWDTTWAYLICFHQGLCDCVKKFAQLSHHHASSCSLAFTDLSGWGWPMRFHLAVHNVVAGELVVFEPPKKNQTLRPWRILQSRCLGISTADRVMDALPYYRWWSWHHEVCLEKVGTSLVKVGIPHQVKIISFIHFQVAKAAEVSFQMSLWISGKLLPDWIKSATHATAWCVPRISG